MANYPNSAPAFTTRNNGDVIDASHPNEIGDEVTAIGSALIGTLQHDVKLASGNYVFTDGRATGDGVWTDYTPTWTGTSPSIGNGTLAGRYTRIGDLVIVQIRLIAGGTTTFGGSEWRFSTPVTALDANVGGVGAVWALDSGTAYYAGSARLASTTEIACYVNGVVTAFSASVPFAWATNDTLNLTVMYPAA
jgi:hypothetical protein